MKNKFLWLGLVTIFCGNVYGARHLATHGGGNFGAGIVLGEPTGLSAKYFQSDRGAIDFTLAFSYGGFFEINVDYLYHFPGAFGNSSRFAADLTPYVGIGGALFVATGGVLASRWYFGTNTSSVGLAVRIPLGLEWRPSDAPIGVFVEFAPGLGIVPATFGLFQGGIGIRYYF